MAHTRRVELSVRFSAAKASVQVASTNDKDAMRSLLSQRRP